MNHENPQQFWERAAQRVCWRVNAGFCLQSFLPVLLGLTLAQGCLLLVLRKIEAPQALLWGGYGIAVLLALAGSAWWSRRRFFATADGLVHLEARLLLHNRLSAARQGRTGWPAPQALPSSFHWTWKRLLLPPAGAAAFLLLAGWIPLKEQSPHSFEMPEEPLAWQEVESWAEVLEERDLFEEESLARWREQVEALRDQPPEEWYSHNSLEAGDNLRDNAGKSIRRLETALEKAAYPLSLARESLDQIPSGLQPLLQEHWLDALSELSSGELTLNKEALAALREIDFTNLQTLSRDQIDRLNKMLREGREACGICSGEGECDGDNPDCAACQSGLCEGTGISRGPGPADLTFREFPNLIDSQRRESVSNPDLSRAALGEQLGTTQTEPEVDLDVPPQISAAGEANLSGEGGDAVFHSRLTPAEQKRLQEYFQ